MTDKIPAEKKLNFDLRPDAQAFDEVRIVTVPRYKESGLSGDEWRFHAEIMLLRKGRVIAKRGCGTVEAACAFLPGFLLQMIDEGHGYFAGDGVHCDQEGCADAATVRLRKLAEYCRSGHKSEPAFNRTYRHFCERHKVRGDCGLDDADANYVEEPLT